MIKNMPEYITMEGDKMYNQYRKGIIYKRIIFGGNRHASFELYNDGEKIVINFLYLVKMKDDIAVKIMPINYKLGECYRKLIMEIFDRAWRDLQKFIN